MYSENSAKKCGFIIGAVIIASLPLITTVHVYDIIFRHTGIHFFRVRDIAGDAIPALRFFYETGGI